MQSVKQLFRKSGKTALAGLLAALVLLLGALAATPALHELIHTDAAQTAHTCVVTLFADGKVDAASGEVPVVLPTVSIETVPSIIFSVPRTTIQNLPSGRAPPAVPSAQA